MCHAAPICPCPGTAPTTACSPWPRASQHQPSALQGCRVLFPLLLWLPLGFSKGSQAVCPSSPGRHRLFKLVSQREDIVGSCTRMITSGSRGSFTHAERFQPGDPFRCDPKWERTHWAVGAPCGIRPYRGSWCSCDFLLPICVPLVIPLQEKDRERKGCKLSTCR